MRAKLCNWCGIELRGWRRWLARYCGECSSALVNLDRPPCPRNSRHPLKVKES